LIHGLFRGNRAALTLDRYAVCSLTIWTPLPMLSILLRTLTGLRVVGSDEISP
jgi:hypothetical protein